MHLMERGYQLGMGIGMKLLPASKQEVLSGAGEIMKVPELLERRGLSRPLIVTGPRVSKTDFFQRLEQALTEAECAPCVFTEVEPDPSTDLIDRVTTAYRIGGCDCFIALGGGSNMDAAKAAAAALARPEKTFRQLGGVMKVRRKTPCMIAIPTTAGTGSECTVAAVVTDSETHRKFAINDPVLCPDAAVLDPDLTADLPPSIVAATGMDALTHAVEAWLNRRYHKRATPGQCAAAVHDIMMYLPFVYGGAAAGKSRARQTLLEASYKARQAFTVACVGNVMSMPSLTLWEDFIISPTVRPMQSYYLWCWRTMDPLFGDPWPGWSGRQGSCRFWDCSPTVMMNRSQGRSSPGSGR